MWVLTESGKLINLDHFYALEVTGPQNEPVVFAYSEHDVSVALCSCDNEEHGKEIVEHIAYALEDGFELYDIRNAKFAVYTCGVCKQQFEVPRRGGEVHYHLYDPVCPDCWTAVQDEKEGVEDGSSI